MHALQAVFIFVAGCLTISVMTKGDIGGATRYYFAMVSTENWSLNLLMVPMWSRTKKFANAYAFLGVDLLYTSKHLDKRRVIKDQS